MRKPKLKKLTWTDVKKALKGVESYQLIELLNELFQLSNENKNFLHARFNESSVSLRNYKKIILDSLYSDPPDDDDNFDFGKADTAIKTYEKASNDNEGTADLNEAFYDALIEMYEKAIKAMQKLRTSKQAPLRKRLKNI